jgi:hypothetical protein
MKQGSRAKSKQTAALVELKLYASELLEAIKSAHYIETKLKVELAAFDRSGDDIDRLETKRRLLLRKTTIETKQLAGIEKGIDISGQLLAIAEVQIGKFAAANSEIMGTIADIQAKIANTKPLSGVDHGDRECGA